MSSIIIFFLTFYLLLISVIGYGILFQNLFFSSIKSMNQQMTIYTGFYGLFLITLISLTTSLIMPHDFIHNITLHFFGVLLFIFNKVKNKKEYLKIIFLISLFTISALLISKTHDDFSYYHFPFTKYLTEQKVIFGMGNLLHGYKLLSSLFFLNSTFYLPHIKYFSFHFTLLYFLIFFNFYIFKELISKNIHEVTKFLYLFAFVFFNLSFNRLAEYGTDKTGQLLIVVLTITLLQIVCFDKKKDLNNFLYLIPLLGLCISLKTYFLPYILFGITILFINIKFSITFKKIFYSKAFIVFLFSICIYFLHHFISTGCIISPISITCFGDSLNWANESASYKRLSIWLEQWAKAGAGPNFRVEEPLIYIKNFNWVSRWFDYYFLGKVSDQLLILFSSFLIIFLIFKNPKTKKRVIFTNKKILFFYTIVFFIFSIWFIKHPTLRYGGYSIVFLTFSIPLALIYQKFNTNFSEKKLKYLIILIILIFNFKNINRINNEFNRADYYKFDNFPFYSIPEKKYFSEQTPSGLTIFKTKGHCWGTPSPCTQSIGKFGFEVEKKNGYYFFIHK